MSLRLSRRFRGWLAVATLVGGGLWAPAGLAQEKSSLEAEAGNLPGTTRTNLTPRVAPRSSRSSLPMNGLLRLEEQLSRSFHFLKPSPPGMNALPAPPLPTHNVAPVQSRRSRDLENKKNWMFANPEDLTKPPTAEDLLKVPEYGSRGFNDKSQRSIERFYQDLEKRNAATAKKQRELLSPDDPRRLRDEFFSSRDKKETEDPNVPSGIRDNEQRLRKLLGLNSAGSAATPGSVADVFGLKDRSAALSDEELARKTYLNDYRQWLNRSATPAPSTGLGSLAGATTPTRQVGAVNYNPFAPFTPSGHYDPSIGAVNPTLATAAPQDITTKVLNQWNPYYAPPKVEVPKVEPPKPSFDVPRRKF